MGTRSTIALEYTDGTVQSVYCHWDGYIDHNGRILFNHYSNPFKLRELIDHGDLSSLGEEIGVKISFDEPTRSKQCKFYKRDRGEENCEADTYWNFEMYEMTGNREEYNYILRTDGKWYVRQDGSNKTFIEMVL